MSMTYRQLADQIRSTIQSYTHDTPALERMVSLQKIRKELDLLIREARNEAAYELRNQGNKWKIAALSGESADNIEFWAKSHREKFHLPPPIRKHKRDDLRGAKDLSLDRRFPTSI